MKARQEPRPPWIGPWARYVHEPESRGLGTVRYPRLIPKDAYVYDLAKRTLTNLYNAPPTWLVMAHKALDEAVFDAVIGVNVTHVPYRGGGPALQDLIGGRIDYQCLDTPVAIPQIESGTVKVIAILSRDRSPSLPNLASAHEQGLTNFEASNWIGLFLPKDTPADIVGRFHAAAVATMDTPSIGFCLIPSTSTGAGMPATSRMVGTMSIR